MLRGIKYFSKDKQMVNRYIKRCSLSLIIREMQVKTTVRYHLILVRIAIIKNTIDKKCRQKKKMWRKKEPFMNYW